MIILYSKFMRLFVGSIFLVSHRRLSRPRHFYNLSPLGTMSDHNWRVFFTRGGIYPFLLISDTYFPFHATVRLCWTLSHLPSPPNQTPNAMSTYQPCTHTHEMRCFLCICNAKCHYMFSHVTCLMNTTIYSPYFMSSIKDNYIAAYNLHPFILIYI